MKKKCIILLAVLSLLAVLCACNPDPVPVPEPPACGHLHRETVSYEFRSGNSRPIYERCCDCGAVTHLVSYLKDVDDYGLPAVADETFAFYDAQSKTIRYEMFGESVKTIKIREDGLIDSIASDVQVLEFSYDFEEGKRTVSRYVFAGEDRIFKNRDYSSIDGGLFYGRTWYEAPEVINYTLSQRLEYDFNPQGDWTECRYYRLNDSETAYITNTREYEYLTDAEGKVFEVICRHAEFEDVSLYPDGKIAIIYTTRLGELYSIEYYMYDSNGLIVRKVNKADSERVQEYTWTEVE